MNLVVKGLLKCYIRFSISFRWCAFPNFWTQISRPLANGVRISPKASTTAGCDNGDGSGGFCVCVRARVCGWGGVWSTHPGITGSQPCWFHRSSGDRPGRDNPWEDCTVHILLIIVWGTAQTHKPISLRIKLPIFSLPHLYISL